MSIELNQRVKSLEQQLAEVNRQIAALSVREACKEPAAVRQLVEEAVKRKPGRPQKNG